jgi:transposase
LCSESTIFFFLLAKSHELRQFLLALLEHSPDIYLDEIQEQLEEQLNIDVSISTVSRTLKRLGITSKKVSGA